MPELLTVTEAAREKGCNRRIIYRNIKRGKLNIEKTGNRYLVIKDAAYAALKINHYKVHHFTDMDERIEKLEKRIAALTNVVGGLVKRIEVIESIFANEIKKWY